MVDKVQKIREEVERLKEWQPIASPSLNKLLSFIDSLQEEPVGIWHDGCEIPKNETNILMIRKDEKNSNYPPIAGCFHGTNSRLDGKNWGYYNGFCYNEIEAPYKWACVDDFLALEEIPPKFPLISPEKCMFTKDSYTDEDRKVLCDGCEEECKCAQKEEPACEDFENAAIKYAQDKYMPVQTSQAFKAGAKWQKEQMMAKAIEGKVIANGMGNPILHLWDKGRHLIGKKVKVSVIEED